MKAHTRTQKKRFAAIKQSQIVGVTRVKLNIFASPRL